jgi:hypothetical protein
MKNKAQLEHALSARKNLSAVLELLTLAGYPHDAGLRPVLRESLRTLEKDIGLAAPSVQYRERLRRYVEGHGFTAEVTAAGAVVFYIPWTRGSEAGSDKQEVYTLEQARAALGY